MMNRPAEIRSLYEHLIDQHLDDLIQGRASEMFEIEDFAEQLHIHPVHFSNTIKDLTGLSPCGIFQQKILETALKLLVDQQLTIKQIALIMTYEPSQFTKWFKVCRELPQRNTVCKY
jgi:AraC family transcriptional regulator of adaptative response / methylphosphotriester-DNA alkyltransferase methyltransferase